MHTTREFALTFAKQKSIVYSRCLREVIANPLSPSALALPDSEGMGVDQQCAEDRPKFANSEGSPKRLINNYRVIGPRLGQRLQNQEKE